MRVMPPARVLAALLFPTLTSLAGPLNPPAGPIAPTAKPLAEVEPRVAVNATNTPGDADSVFRIAQPGSYYLTGNVAGVSGKCGIEIAAGGVTLDLNGFELLGVPGSTHGVTTSTALLANITVCNGTLRNWGAAGVNISSFPPASCTLRDLMSSGNTLGGISAGDNVTITGCTAVSNGSNGVATGNGCAVTNCAAYSNGGNGFDVGTGSVVTGCVARLNGRDGFECGSAATLTNCVAQENEDNGVYTLIGCTITGCTFRGNTLHGLHTGSGCTISLNTSRSNGGDGVRADGFCLITSNTCTGNGLTDGAGICVTGGDNRIEGNLCSSQDRGIDADVGGNIIVRNTCASNTLNWAIAAGNYYGPIIDRVNVGTPGVAGNSASSTLATTDPHANFTH